MAVFERESSHVIDIRESESDKKPKKKRKHHAYFTAMVICVNALMFIITICLYHKKSGRIFEPFPSGNPNLGPDAAVLIALGARDTPLIRDHHEWWRLITAMFLHAGLIHIVFNTTCLWSIGAPLERTFGTAGICVIYLMSGLTG